MLQCLVELQMAMAGILDLTVCDRASGVSISVLFRQACLDS